MSQGDAIATEQEQLRALTSDVMRAYAADELSWSQIRERFGVLDFSLMLRRLGEEGLALPRAPSHRPTLAREWLREALRQAATR